MSTTSVVLNLPPRLLRAIDRLEGDRARFVYRAVRREVRRRRRDELRRSLEQPHTEALALAEVGFDAWARSLPDEDALALVTAGEGRPMRWIEGRGWTEVAE